MAVPKRKTTPSKRGMRCSHDALKKLNPVVDKETGNHKRCHHVDLKTGIYRGRQAIKIKTPKAHHDHDHDHEGNA